MIVGGVVELVKLVAALLVIQGLKGTMTQVLIKTKVSRVPCLASILWWNAGPGIDPSVPG